MQHHDELTSASDDFCFAKPGEIYAIYLPQGGSTEIQLEEGTYKILWYDPRSGCDLQNGNTLEIQGPGMKSIGNPPSEPSQDWVVLIRK